MKRICQIISLSLLISVLCSCFRKREDTFQVTYKVDSYAECSYSVTISFIDSTGREAWVCTNNAHWSKTVNLPKGCSASLVAYPFHKVELNKRDLERGFIPVDRKIHLSAKIISGDKSIKDESSKIVSLVLSYDEAMN